MEPKPNEKISAIEAYRKPSQTAPYEPRSYEEAIRMADTLAKSSLLGALKSPEAVFLVMATGAELQIPPTAALRSIHIVQGKPVLSADLIVALCLKRPDICEHFTCVESTEKSATYETKRVNSGPVRNSFTLEDAARAGLAAKDNWKNYVKAMLRHRAAAELARMVYPDLVLGLYAEEEIQVNDSREEYRPAPVQEVIEGEVIEDRHDRVAEWAQQYADATDMIAVKATDGLIAAAKLGKGSPERNALASARKEAVERITAASREPGQEG